MYRLPKFEVIEDTQELVCLNNQYDVKMKISVCNKPECCGKGGLEEEVGK